MKPIELIKDFFLVFVITFVVVSLVTYLYGLLVHSSGTFDWATSFRLAIVLGIVFSWLHYRERKKKITE
ncbi:MAG: hypothetical protein Q8N03_14065 [Ignavibacteria bacterium]|jgi:uncharacterized membrane protein YadS|nr:hypothetical protein [Ignavibacteria bacterium]